MIFFFLLFFHFSISTKERTKKKHKREKKRKERYSKTMKPIFLIKRNTRGICCWDTIRFLFSALLTMILMFTLLLLLFLLLFAVTAVHGWLVYSLLWPVHSFLSLFFSSFHFNSLRFIENRNGSLLMYR